MLLYFRNTRLSTFYHLARGRRREKEARPPARAEERHEHQADSQRIGNFQSYACMQRTPRIFLFPSESYGNIRHAKHWNVFYMQIRIELDANVSPISTIGVEGLAQRPGHDARR